MSEVVVNEKYIKAVREQLKKITAKGGGAIVRKDIMLELLKLAESGLEYRKLITGGRDLERIFRETMDKLKYKP